MEELQNVTRFEVIDPSAHRAYVKYGVSVSLSLQDDGRTLKVFLKDSDIATAEEVHEELVRGLGDWIMARENTDDCGICTRYSDGTVLIRKECPEHGLET